MNPRRYELLHDAVTMLKSRGATNIQHRIGGRHIKLHAVYHGMPIMATMAITPSDWRACRNNRALLRRMLQAIDSNQGATP